MNEMYSQVLVIIYKTKSLRIKMKGKKTHGAYIQCGSTIIC